MSDGDAGHRLSGHVHPLSRPGSRRGPYRATEGDIQREYYVEQFKTLIRRHRVEDVLLVRVLTDYYQLAANRAKAGETAEAKSQLLAMARDIDVPDDEELRLAANIAELPVWALVHWLEGDAPAAIERLRTALASGHVLAGTYGHGYLTTRRIYIGVNLSRVLVTSGDHDAASRLIRSLKAVAAGDRAQWPFEGADSLAVPLTGMYRSIIGWHLNRAQSMLPDAAGARSDSG